MKDLQQRQSFSSDCKGQLASSGIPSEERVNFVDAKFYETMPWCLQLQHLELSH